MITFVYHIRTSFEGSSVPGHYLDLGLQGFYLHQWRQRWEIWLLLWHTGINLWMRPANERRRYIVTSSLIGWAHTRNDPWSHQIRCYSGGLRAVEGWVPVCLGSNPTLFANLAHLASKPPHSTFLYLDKWYDALLLKWILFYNRGSHKYRH